MVHAEGGLADRARHRLLGREAEIGLIGRVLDEARTQPTALVITGEPGIGKSAVVGALRELAAQAGWLVAACRPAESETAFAHSALSDLLGPLLNEFLGELPGPQQAALDQALHRRAVSVGDSPTPMVVAAATTGLLMAAAGRMPLCVLIDDVQWLDQASRQALRFAFRRLSGGGVLVAVAERGEPGEGDEQLGLRSAFNGGTLHSLALASLTRGALHALLRRELGFSLPRTRLIELHMLTRGNPYFALEIGRVLAARGLPRGPADPLPVPHSLGQLLAARLAETPQSTELMQVLGAASRPTMTVIAAAWGSTERAQASLDEAVGAGLVALEGDRVRPAHPLLASHAYAALDPGGRRRLHGSLAAVESDPESRARHLALATVGRNVAVAVALERAAGIARSRGATDTAAELLGMAVDRTPVQETDLGRRRHLLYAEALFDAGDLTRARDAADELLAGPVEPELVGRLGLLRGTIAWYTETSRVAVTHLEWALKQGLDDPAQVGRIKAHLGIFTDWDWAAGRRHLAEAVEQLEKSDTTNPVVAGSLSVALCELFYSEAMLGEPPREKLVERALAIEPDLGHVDRSTIPGIWWTAIDRFAEAARRYEALLEVARATGDLSSEADLLTHLAVTTLSAGDLRHARELADEATATAQQEGQDHPDPALRVRALVAALAGELDAAEQAADEALTRLEAGEDHYLAAAWLVVLVGVAAARGDSERVVSLGRRSAAHLAAVGIREGLRLDMSGERAAALAALGRVDEARAVLGDLIDRERRIPRPSLRAQIVRVEALVANTQRRLPAAIDLTGTVLTDEADNWPPLERGRTLLLRGQLCRRARDRRGAREALEAARDTFEQMGAAGWAQQAVAELARLGRYRPGLDELTPTEQEVAELAASGLSTREVAARLFTSPKTVEAHVGRVYAKLGISSRAELGARMARHRS